MNLDIYNVYNEYNVGNTKLEKFYSGTTHWRLLNKLSTHGACLNHVRNYVCVNYGYYAVLTYTTYQISSVWDYTKIGENLVLAK